MRALWAQVRQDAASLVLLGVLVLVAALLASLVPRQLTATEHAALTAAVETASVQRREVSVLWQGRATPEALAATGEELADLFEPALRDLVGPPLVTTTTPPLDVEPAEEPRVPPIQLVAQVNPAFEDLTVWDAGRAPSAQVTRDEQSERSRGDLFETETIRRSRTVEVGMSRAAAAHLGVDVGDVLPAEAVRTEAWVEDAVAAAATGFSSRQQVTYFQVLFEVTGLFSAAEGSGDAWDTARSVFLTHPVLSFDATIVAEQAAVLAHPGALATLNDLANTETTWRFPVDVSAVASDQIAALDAASRAATRVDLRPASEPVRDLWGGWYTPSNPVRAFTGIPALMTELADDVATAMTLGTVTFLGLGAVALAAIAMAAVQLQAQRTRATALARARGVSLRQVWATTLPPATVVVLVAGGAGLVAGALLVPGQGWDAPVLLTAAVCAVAVLAVAAATAADYRRTDRSRTRAAHRGRRVAAELGVVLLAVAGVVLLQQRGLAPGTEDGGADPFLALVPVLLALAAGLVALRLRPLPTALAARAARSGRGAAAFVGLTSARRAPGWNGSAALVVLVVAVAFSVFASAVFGTVTAGQQRASWARTGADVVVTGSGVDDALASQVESSDGVRKVVRATRIERAELQTGLGAPQRVVVLAVDAAAFADARSSSGVAAAVGADDVATLARTAPGDPVPVLLPEGADASADRGGLALGRGLSLQVDVLGASPAVPAASGQVAGGTAGSPLEVPVVLVDGDALRAALAAAVGSDHLPQAAGVSEALLVFTDDDASARSVAGAITTTVDLEVLDPDRPGLDPGDHVLTSLRADVLAALSDAPLARGTSAVIVLGVVASGGFGMLAVALGLLAGAPERARSLSVLRTLGMGPRDARALLVLELVPLVGVAVLTGTGVGLALLPLTATGLDLRPFTGTVGLPELSIHPAQVLLVAGATVLVAVVAVVGAVLADRRRHLGSALRVGGPS